MAMLWSFLLCYSANLSSSAVSDISEIAYNGNWPQYPLIYRKYVQSIILRSQSSTTLMGYKLVHCDLETFGKVSKFVWIQCNSIQSKSFFIFLFQLIKSAWYYYLILKNLSKWTYTFSVWIHQLNLKLDKYCLMNRNPIQINMNHSWGSGPEHRVGDG